MEKLILYILQNIVKHPEDITVNSETTGSDRPVTTYYITANEEDLPTIIGKNGRTIKGLRNIVKVKAIKDRNYIDIRIKDY